MIKDKVYEDHEDTIHSLTRNLINHKLFISVEKETVSYLYKCLLHTSLIIKGDLIDND